MSDKATAATVLDAKQRVERGLEALRIGLGPYVGKHMRDRHGNHWRHHASRARGGEAGGELDAYALLKTLLDNWNDLFRHDDRLRKARSFISIALDARHAVSHFAGELSAREALRYLDALREVAAAVAAPQAGIIEKLYDEQAASGGTGDAPAVETIADSEDAGTNPGSERLIPILRSAAPCLILMDEVVAFARQLRGIEYDAFHAFIQSLTEAAAAVHGVVVVGSLPESGAEVGDEQGRDALQRLEKIFGRVQSAWTPASGAETFESSAGGYSSHSTRRAKRCGTKPSGRSANSTATTVPIFRRRFARRLTKTRCAGPIRCTPRCCGAFRATGRCWRSSRGRAASSRSWRARSTRCGAARARHR